MDVTISERTSTLNTHEEAPQLYTAFYGPLAVTMPRLLAKSLSPILTREVIDRRLSLDNLGVFRSLREYWLNQDITTGDAVMRGPNGNLKFVIDSPLLREVNPTDAFETKSGFVGITDEQYQKAEGENVLEIPADAIIMPNGKGPFHASYINRPEVVKSVWEFLSPRSQEYFEKLERGIDERMRLHLPAIFPDTDERSTPVIAPIRVNGTPRGSDIYTLENPFYRDVHLIGVDRDFAEFLEIRSKIERGEDFSRGENLYRIIG